MSWQGPYSLNEERYLDAREAAHEADCAAMEQEILATPESAAEVIFEALGLDFDPATAFKGADGPFLLAVAAIYADACNRYGTDESPLVRKLVDVLHKPLQAVIDNALAENERDRRARHIAAERVYQASRGAQA